MSWVRGLPLLAAAVVVTLVPVGAGVLLSSPPSAPPAEPLATPLASLDTTAMTLARAPFCDRVPAADVTAALGEAADDGEAWSNGDPVTLPDGSTDVGHEYGCRWSLASGAAVAAWVFAPPVTPESAAALVTAAGRTEGCTPVTGAPAYGSPSVALTCGSTVSFRGLFGDAWLVCEATSLPAPGAGGDPVERAGRWCSSVALAARTNSTGR